MSIDNYDELKTAIANWLNDSNLTARIPEFIELAEADLNRRVTGAESDATATVTISSGASIASKPSGFREVIEFYYTDTLEEPDKVTPQQLTDLRNTDASTRPSYYAISTTFLFDTTADQNYTLKCLYRKGLDIAGDSTNWLLTDHPDIYLYTALAQAEPYLMNDSRIALWKTLSDERIDKLNEVAQRVRKAPLRTEVGASGRYDIQTDS